LEHNKKEHHFIASLPRPPSARTPSKFEGDFPFVLKRRYRTKYFSCTKKKDLANRGKNINRIILFLFLRFVLETIINIVNYCI
jgi:hypothetical protein